MFLNKLLDFNNTFVESEEYVTLETSKFPDKRLVIFSCMDTRLVELLPKALNLKNGDVKMVKNAGAVLTHPFGSIMRSLLVAVYELQADEILVIGHHDCGMKQFNGKALIDKMKQNGVTEDTLNTLEYAGVDLDKWLNGFDRVEDSVAESVKMIRNHPLLPKNTPVHGLVIDPKTGRLDLVEKGYEE